MMTSLMNGLSEVGEWFYFSRTVFSVLFKKGMSKDEWLNQMVQIGTRSIPITCVAGFFVGAVLAIQIDLQLKDFGAQSFLGGLSTSTTLRNLGPVLIAFLLAGRVGAYTSAELGTMAITEQINALRCLGLNPIQVLIIPRFAALIISSFLLLMLGLGMTVIGGMVVSSLLLDVNPIQFSSHIPQFVSQVSVIMGMVKSLLFGVVIGTVSCFFGYYVSGGAEEVGRAVRRTAVVTMVAIIVMDFIVSFCGNSLIQFLGNRG
jgi:phospholipid/cholesterol/gamma-HCH transport system permease protein